MLLLPALDRAVKPVAGVAALLASGGGGSDAALWAQRAPGIGTLLSHLARALVDYNVSGHAAGMVSSRYMP